MVLPKAVLYKTFLKYTYMQIESKLGTGDQRSLIYGKIRLFSPYEQFH